MARPSRIQWAAGRYHITARGNERRAIFRDDRDRQHFLELLEEQARLSGGVGYTAVAQAIPRVRRDIHRDKALRWLVEKVSAQLSKMKM